MPQAVEQDAGQDNGTGEAAMYEALDTTPATPTSTRGKTKYAVCIDADSRETIHGWVLDDNGESPVPTDLTEALPPRGDDNDLCFLGAYSAANKDAAVDMMLTDKKPTDRVRLVQLAHEAHLDLYFPAPPASFLTAVPKEWQQEWTLKAAGRS